MICGSIKKAQQGVPRFTLKPVHSILKASEFVIACWHDGLDCQEMCIRISLLSFLVSNQIIIFTNILTIYLSS